MEPDTNSCCFVRYWVVVVVAVFSPLLTVALIYAKVKLLKDFLINHFLAQKQNILHNCIFCCVYPCAESYQLKNSHSLWPFLGLLDSIYQFLYSRQKVWHQHRSVWHKCDICEGYCEEEDRTVNLPYTPLSSISVGYCAVFDRVCLDCYLFWDVNIFMGRYTACWCISISVFIRLWYVKNPFAWGCVMEKMQQLHWL